MMTEVRQERQGELLLVAFSFLESWFPIISAFAVALVGAVYSYAFTVLIAAAVFMTIVCWRGKLHELCKRSAWPDLLLTSFFITLMFGLIFIGVKYTTSGNVAVIIMMQLFFSFLYFNVLGSEKLFNKQVYGALAMGCGAVAILFPDELLFNRGDILVLAAAAVAPLANYFQKRARTKVSSVTILGFRSMAAFPVLLFIGYLFEPTPTLAALRGAAVFLLINGVLLMGVSKILWLEAIHRISITKACAMCAFIPLFTIVLAFFLRDELVTPLDGSGAAMIMAGAYLITRLPPGSAEQPVPG
ncbi:MAG: DMT family transporter [Thermodesulfobacteriota bacterium]